MGVQNKEIKNKMWKFKRTVRKIDSSKPKEHSSLYKLVLAVAMALKVTPRRIANNLEADKQKRFAEKLSTELEKKKEQMKEKAKKELELK